MRLAFFGGIYSNSYALLAAIDDARGRGAERLFCLGDLGAFGPYPDRVFPLLGGAGVECLQGNYDESVGNDRRDCQCGYTDPRDNDYARLSYDYTYENTSPLHRGWLRTLPKQRRLEVDGKRFLLCHGSPRRVNEFLWESTTSTHFLEKLCRDYSADVILGTHTGIHWERRLADGKRFVNVGVLGRPENDGTTSVWYTLLTHAPAAGLSIEFVPVEYDHRRLAGEMGAEELPEEFAATILTGWWTTCLEVLPSKERRRGIY